MNPLERRSVGELLQQADLDSRRLLLDPDSLDAAGMIRVWPELVQAGYELIAALPGPGHTIVPGVEGTIARTDRVTERLNLMATALNDSLRGRTWPAGGPGDERLLTITGALVHAHDLIARHLRASDQPSQALLSDAAATRTRVLHTLYVTAHAISLATKNETRDLQTSPRARQRRAGVHKLTALKLVAARIATFEQAAGAEVYRSFPAKLASERREAAAPDRLRTALAAWEIETHRAMAHEPTMANICEVTRVNAATIALSHLLLDAAGSDSVIDRATYRADLQPVLATAESAWSGLHALTRDLTGAGPRAVARDLGLAGAQLVTAMTDMALQHTSVAPTASLTPLAHSHGVSTTITRALESLSESADLLLDAVLDPRLSVAAVAAQQVLTALASGASETPSPNEPWVDPRDLALGRHVALPAPIRGALVRLVENVDQTSRGIGSAVGRPSTIESPHPHQADGPRARRHPEGPIARPRPAQGVAR